MEFLQTDLETLNRKGITPDQFVEQLEMLRDGFPYLNIEAPAKVGHGITSPSPEMTERSIAIWEEFLAAGGSVQKLVPASGAASRMFKDLFSFINGKKDKPDNDFMKAFFARIADFAFFPYLNSICMHNYGKSVYSLLDQKRYKDIVAALIESGGLNYGQLPKGLLEFHKSLGGSRSALAEHLAEGAQYAVDKHGNVRVHFTVSEDHIPLFESRIEELKGWMQMLTGVKYDITLSVQKPSTDTVAANPDGTPYRENGEIFFRPGGHGALIENINDLDSDVIFIKNIDNVVPDALRDTTVLYKKVIGGILVATKQKAERAAFRRGSRRDACVPQRRALRRESRSSRNDTGRQVPIPYPEAEPADARMRHGSKRRRTGRRPFHGLFRRRQRPAPDSRIHPA